MIAGRMNCHCFAGTVIDSSSGREPLTYLHGAGNIVPGLEKEMVGRAPGDKFDVVALAATSADNAWMLAKPDDRLDRGIVLYHRVVSGGTAV